jgi:hypothetical protein
MMEMGRGYYDHRVAVGSLVSEPPVREGRGRGS